jgi:gamma-glutamylcyclotransferase (GGCT)/AIG2-like uncharacterized protein YtfP
MHKIFVYGTLKAQSPDTHKTKAKMWNVGAFPCVLLSEKGEVSGQVMDVTDAQLRELDAYENVPFLYTREKTKAFSESGYEEDVWVYEWARDIDGLEQISLWENDV